MEQAILIPSFRSSCLHNGLKDLKGGITQELESYVKVGNHVKDGGIFRQTLSIFMP